MENSAPRSSFRTPCKIVEIKIGGKTRFENLLKQLFHSPLSGYEVIITNSRYALVGYFITSYPTRAHGIIVIYRSPYYLHFLSQPYSSRFILSSKKSGKKNLPISQSDRVGKKDCHSSVFIGSSNQLIIDLLKGLTPRPSMGDRGS